MAATVAEFLAGLDHPFKEEILALRAIILGASPDIGESIKWNAPSFHTTEHFATFHLRARDGVQVVLHLGAKPRTDVPVRSEVRDPLGLLQWKSPDRATVTFAGLQDVEANGGAFADIIRQWVSFI